LIAATGTACLYYYDLTRIKCLHTPDTITYNAVFASQNLAVLGLDDGIIEIWDLKKFTRLFSLEQFLYKDNIVGPLVFSPDRKLLASGFKNQPFIVLWDTESWYPKIKLLTSYPAFSLAFSNDGRFLAMGSNSEVLIWDVFSGINLCTLTSKGKRIMGVSFSPGEKQVYAGSSDGFVEIWDITSGCMAKDLK